MNNTVFWVEPFVKYCGEKCCQTVIGYRCKGIGSNSGNTEVASRTTQDYPGTNGCGLSSYYDCTLFPPYPTPNRIYYPCTGDYQWHN